jgi:diketogulonate reductase-like aldo/keto reductase
MMEFRKLYDGTKVPVLGMGTWGMGGFRERDESNVAQSIDALRRGISLGMTHIDTAEIYGAGLTEELVGKAIKGFDRSQLIISSKFWKYSSGEEVIRAVKASLKRLGTQYLDLSLAHRVPDDDCFKDVVGGMKSLLKEGLVKHIGVSNFSIDQLKKTCSCLGSTRLSAMQVEYNLANQSAREEYFGFCRENGILVIAHRPLAEGVLADDKSILQDLSKRYGKSPAQIALRWIVQQDNLVTIPKALNQAHLEENLGAIGWKLEEEDMELLFRYSR